MSKLIRIAGIGGRLLAAVALVVSVSAAARAQERSELEALSLEELMNIQVTSVSKRPQRLIDTPAAIFVITRDDIRRSGLQSVPELLRMVPGAAVGQFTPKSWGIGIRGDESQFARMLLVLVDGRAAYTTAFNGTFWDTIDMPLEDIDRIEVIRGPGASVWGANAVQGVINIIRRKPEDAQEPYASLTIGDEERALTSLGYGGSLGDRLKFRMSTRYVNRDSFASHDGSGQQHDGYRNGVAGFRGDLRVGKSDTLTLQGDWYGGDRGTEAGRSLDTSGANNLMSFERYSVSGYNALTRYEIHTSETSSTEFQAYLDRRSQDLIVVDDTRVHTDFEFRNRFKPSDRNTFNWGAGARHIQERIGNTLNFIATPRHQDEAIYNIYLQDELAAIPNELTFTAGSKFEFNTYTGWEIQPTARFLWAPLEHQQIWGAVSRAVRIPSRVDIGEYQLNPTYLGPGLPFGFQGVRGNPSEIVIATELGYRLQASSQLSVDIATFIEDTQNFQVFVLGGPVNNVLFLSNIAERTSEGAELSVRYRPFDYWSLVASYTHLHTRNTTDNFTLSGHDSAPHHQATLFSYLDLPGNLELDLFAYYHGPFGTNKNPNVSSTFNGWKRFDARLAWHPTPRLEVSVVGQNLANRRHLEGLDFFEGSMPISGQPVSEVERSVYGRVGVSF